MLNLLQLCRSGSMLFNGISLNGPLTLATTGSVATGAVTGSTALSVAAPSLILGSISSSTLLTLSGAVFVSGSSLQLQSLSLEGNACVSGSFGVTAPLNVSLSAGAVFNATLATTDSVRWSGVGNQSSIGAGAVLLPSGPIALELNRLTVAAGAKFLTYAITFSLSEVVFSTSVFPGASKFGKDRTLI